MSDEIEFFSNDESDWAGEDISENNFTAKYAAPAGMSGPWNNFETGNSETPNNPPAGNAQSWEAVEVSPKTGAIIAPPASVVPGITATGDSIEFESAKEPAQTVENVKVNHFEYDNVPVQPAENIPEAALTKLEQWNIDTEQLVREIEDAEDKLEDGQESARRQLYDWETKAKRNIRNMKRKLADLRAAKPKGK